MKIRISAYTMHNMWAKATFRTIYEAQNKVEFYVQKHQWLRTSSFNANKFL